MPYQISLKADERDVYEFFSRAGKVILHLLVLLASMFSFVFFFVDNLTLIIESNI